MLLSTCIWESQILSTLKIYLKTHLLCCWIACFLHPLEAVKELCTFSNINELNYILHVYRPDFHANFPYNSLTKILKNHQNDFSNYLKWWKSGYSTSDTKESTPHESSHVDFSLSGPRMLWFKQRGQCGCDLTLPNGDCGRFWWRRWFIVGLFRNETSWLL